MQDGYQHICDFVKIEKYGEQTQKSPKKICVGIVIDRPKDSRRGSS